MPLPIFSCMFSMTDTSAATPAFIAYFTPISDYAAAPAIADFRRQALRFLRQPLR
jgi:hypothetical protein